MSEPHAPAAPGGGGKKENVFTHKLGPLPMWGWVAGVAAILVAWRMYSAKKNGSNQPASGTSGSGSSGLAGGASPYDIPQFVNQTYTTVTAPPSPTYTHPRDHDDHDHDHPPDRGPDHPQRKHDPDDHHHGPKGRGRGKRGAHQDHDHDQGQDQNRDPDRDQNGRGGGFGGGGGYQGGGRDGQHWSGQWNHRSSPSSDMHADHANRGGGSDRYGRDR